MAPAVRLAILIMLAMEGLFAAPVACAGEADRVYILARAPQRSPAHLQQAWQPFVDRLSERSGVRLGIHLYRNRADFESALFAGTPDFVFMNPLHSVLARKRRGYLPLLRDDAEPLIGIIVVRRDSPVTSVQELTGRAILFPDPNALAASVYPRAMLIEKEHLQFSGRYANNPENVYRSVFLGDVVAGGGTLGTLREEPVELREQLRIIYETPPLTPHPLVAHPRVPANVRQRLIDAILAMANDPYERPLLVAVNLTRPIVADYARDYASLETMGLERYLLSTVSGP